MQSSRRNELRFLESTDHLRKIIGANSRRELSYDQANQIAVCLEQGRLFYEAAENAPWEIRPLLIYYGIMGFSAGVIMARRLSKLESLPKAHGLTDKSPDITTVSHLTARFESDGIFHRVNDCCSELEGLIVHPHVGEKRKLSNPTASSDAICKKEFTLKDVLARIPTLAVLYRKTFDEQPCVVDCSHFSEEDGNLITFEVLDFRPFNDLPSLEKSVTELRAKYDFLNAWTVISASPGSAIEFANIERDINEEFSPQILLSRGSGFASHWIAFDTDTGTHRRLLGTESPTFPIGEIAAHCQPVRGCLTPSPESAFLIEPFEGVHVCEFSLHYIGMFLLSSVIRYRPNVWANAIARRMVSDRRPDDGTLALAEAFMDLSLTVIPDAVIVALNDPY